MCVAGLGSVALLAAQEGANAQDSIDAEVKQLLARLGADDTRGAAFARLLELGAVAVPALTNAIGAADPAAEPKRFEHLLLLAEELGPGSASTLEVLRSQADLAEGRMQWRILWCIVSVAPFAGAAGSEPLRDAQFRFRNGMKDENADMAARERDAQGWWRALQTGPWRGVALNSEVAPARFLVELESDRSITGRRRELAAVLLSYAPDRSHEETRRGIELLSARLERPCRRTSASSGGVRFDAGPKTHRRFAASLLRLEPERDVALRAHTYLLRHGLRHEQWRALQELRNAQVAVKGYQSALRELAENESTARDLRLECVTTLGMLPELGHGTVLGLRRWAKSEDPQLAVRARAALRSVGQDPERDGRRP